MDDEGSCPLASGSAIEAHPGTSLPSGYHPPTAAWGQVGGEARVFCLAWGPVLAAIYPPSLLSPQDVEVPARVLHLGWAPPAEQGAERQLLGL